jgi:hypothetical protein
VSDWHLTRLTINFPAKNDFLLFVKRGIDCFYVQFD